MGQREWCDVNYYYYCYIVVHVYGAKNCNGIIVYSYNMHLHLVYSCIIRIVVVWILSKCRSTGTIDNLWELLDLRNFYYYHHHFLLLQFHSFMCDLTSGNVMLQFIVFVTFHAYQLLLSWYAKFSHPFEE